MHLLEKCVDVGFLYPIPREGEDLLNASRRGCYDGHSPVAPLQHLLSIARSGSYHYDNIHAFFMTYLRMLNVEEDAPSLEDWLMYWRAWCAMEAASASPLSSPQWEKAFLQGDSNISALEEMTLLSGGQAWSHLSDSDITCLTGYFISQSYGQLFSLLLSAPYWTQDLDRIRRAFALSAMIHNFVQMLTVQLHARGMHQHCYPFFFLPAWKQGGCEQHIKSVVARLVPMTE